MLLHNPAEFRATGNSGSLTQEHGFAAYELHIARIDLQPQERTGWILGRREFIFYDILHMSAEF